MPKRRESTSESSGSSDSSSGSGSSGSSSGSSASSSDDRRKKTKGKTNKVRSGKTTGKTSSKSDKGDNVKSRSLRDSDKGLTDERSRNSQHYKNKDRGSSPVRQSIPSPIRGRNRASPTRGRGIGRNRGGPAGPIRGRNKESPTRSRDREHLARESRSRSRDEESPVRGPIRGRDRQSADREQGNAARGRDRQSPVRDRDMGDSERLRSRVGPDRGRGRIGPERGRGRIGPKMGRSREGPVSPAGREGGRQSPMREDANYYMHEHQFPPGPGGRIMSRDAWRGRASSRNPYRAPRGGPQPWREGRRLPADYAPYPFDNSVDHGENVDRDRFRPFNRGRGPPRDSYGDHFERRSFDRDIPPPHMFKPEWGPGVRRNFDYVSRGPQREQDFSPEYSRHSASPPAALDENGGNTPPVLRELRHEILNQNRWNDKEKSRSSFERHVAVGEWDDGRSSRGSHSGSEWHPRSPAHRSAGVKGRTPKEIREITVTKKKNPDRSSSPNEKIQQKGKVEQRKISDHVKEKQKSSSKVKTKKKQKLASSKKKKQSSSSDDSSSSSSDSSSSEESPERVPKKKAEPRPLDVRLLKLSGTSSKVNPADSVGKGKRSTDNSDIDTSQKRRNEKGDTRKSNMEKKERAKNYVESPDLKQNKLEKKSDSVKSLKTKSKTNLPANEDKKSQLSSKTVSDSDRKSGTKEIHTRMTRNKLDKMKVIKHRTVDHGSSDSVSSSSESEGDKGTKLIAIPQLITPVGVTKDYTKLLETDEETFKISKSPPCSDATKNTLKKKRDISETPVNKPSPLATTDAPKRAISPIMAPASRPLKHTRGDRTSGNKYPSNSESGEVSSENEISPHKAVRSTVQMYVQPEKNSQRRSLKSHGDNHYKVRSRNDYEAELRSYQRDRQREHGDRTTASQSGEKSDKHRQMDKKHVDNVVSKTTEDNSGKKSQSTTITGKTGGAYIPPAKLREMQAHITDKSSDEYQRIAWESLKKSMIGLVNKVNTSNLVEVVRELLKENIVRGQGALCRSIMLAQAASPTFTHVYAALVAIINTKFPQTGELILKRVIIQFRRGFRRNDKDTCLSSVRFIAHLVNQQVAHEVLALEVLTVLLENATDDSVEVAIEFMKQAGAKLTQVAPRGVNSIFDRLRNVLHESLIEKRVQYMVEVMFAIRKDGFKDYVSVLEDLDLVDENDQFTHLLTLDDDMDAQTQLNVFKFDAEFEENDEKYTALRKKMLEESSSDESGSESGDEEESAESQDEEAKQTIIDSTETNVIALRRIIFLTIQSSLDFEECAHKMMKLDLKPGQEVELCNMVLDCCAQLRTYEKFYGLLAQRFCQINRKFVGPMQDMFKDQFETVHRLETDKLRNVSRFFAHLLYTDAISWGVLAICKLTEDDTTSASRIFLKILFQELSSFLGVPKLNARLQDPSLQQFFEGLLPHDNPKNSRFAINFFTTIGLGGLTDELRDHLSATTKKIQEQKEREAKTAAEAAEAAEKQSSDSSSSEDSSDGSDAESTDSDTSSDDKSNKDESSKKRQWKHTEKKNVKAAQKVDKSGAKAKKGKSAETRPDKTKKKESSDKMKKRKGEKEENAKIESKKRRTNEEGGRLYEENANEYGDGKADDGRRDDGRRDDLRRDEGRRYDGKRDDGRRDDGRRFEQQWNRPRMDNYGRRPDGPDRPRNQWSGDQHWQRQDRRGDFFDPRKNFRDVRGGHGPTIIESEWVHNHSFSGNRGRGRGRGMRR